MVGDRKARGKYVEMHEPWTALGIKENTFHARVKAEAKRGEIDGPAHKAKEHALAIGRGEVVPDPVEAPAPAVEVERVEPSAVPMNAKGEPTTPSEPMPHQPALVNVRPDPVVPSETMPAAGATVNVTFRCPPSIHDRMREMAHKRRVKLQGIVGAAVEAYLSQNGF